MGNMIRFHRGGLCLTGESDGDDQTVYYEGEKPDGIAFRAFASRTSQRDVDTFGKLPDGAEELDNTMQGSFEATRNREDPIMTSVAGR